MYYIVFKTASEVLLRITIIPPRAFYNFPRRVPSGIPLVFLPGYNQELLPDFLRKFICDSSCIFSWESSKNLFRCFCSNLFQDPPEMLPRFYFGFEILKSYFWNSSRSDFSMNYLVIFPKFLQEFNAIFPQEFTEWFTRILEGTPGGTPEEGILKREESQIELLDETQKAEFSKKKGSKKEVFEESKRYS